MTPAVAIMLIALAGVVLILADRWADRRNARRSDADYKSGYADGKRHAKGDANVDFFNARGATR